MQAAYSAFRTTISSLLLDELVQRGVPETRPLRLADSVVYLPSPSSSLPSSKEPALSLVQPPAIKVTIPPPSLNQSAIYVLSSVCELSFTPPTSDLPHNTPLVLAPVDLPATLVRTLSRVPHDHVARLASEWRHELDRARIPEDERNDYLLCVLDLPNAKDSQDRIEVIWPRALVIVDSLRKSSPPDDRHPPEAGPAAASQGAHEEPAATSSKSLETVVSREKENRPARGSPQLVRRADSSLRRRGFADRAFGTKSAATSRRPSAVSDEHAVASTAREGGGKNVVRRRTGSVWGWMGDEGKRREDEREEEKKRKEREEKERAERAKHEKDAEQDKGRAQVFVPTGAAAPINMRTPMSLGTSSTEAPSPAELYQPLGSSTGHSDPAVHASTAEAHVGDAAHAMEIDFGADVYPSPAEPGLLNGSAAQPASSAPMSALDAAFSEFDWGDGTFGTSGVGRGERDEGHDRGYSDGGLLGLTDDDFSFFDAPTPAPASSALATSIGLSMTAPTSTDVGDPTFPALPNNAGIDTGFDLFSTAPPHFTATAPTSLPYTSDGVFGSATSPHFLQQSPAATFPFGALDPLTPNALGLAGPSPHDPTPSAGIFGTLAQAPPAMPEISVTTPMSSTSPAALSFSPLLAQSAATFAPAQHVLGSVHQCGGFEPLPFATSQSESDAKYDPRKGKFGLPSPDSDHEARAARPHEDDEGHLRRWYEAVCNPRLAVAQRLRRPKGTAALSESVATVGRSDSDPRPWTRRLSITSFVPFSGEGATPASFVLDPADVEVTDVVSDSDDAMDVDGGEPESRSVGSEVEDDDTSTSLRLLWSSCHSALLVEPQAVRRKKRPEASTGTGREAPPAAADTARELTYALIAEQVVVNSEFREPAKLESVDSPGLGTPKLAACSAAR